MGDHRDRGDRVERAGLRDPSKERVARQRSRPTVEPRRPHLRGAGGSAFHVTRRRSTSVARFGPRPRHGSEANGGEHGARPISTNAVFEHRRRRHLELFHGRDGRFFVTPRGREARWASSRSPTPSATSRSNSIWCRFPGADSSALSSLAWDAERGRVVPPLPRPRSTFHPTIGSTGRGTPRTGTGCAPSATRPTCEVTTTPNSGHLRDHVVRDRRQLRGLSRTGLGHVEWAEIQPMARPDRARLRSGRSYSATASTPRSRSSSAPPATRAARSSATGITSPTASSSTAIFRLGRSMRASTTPDGQILDEVYVWGSFTQSKMYANDVKLHRLPRRPQHEASSSRATTSASSVTGRTPMTPPSITSTKRFHEGEPSDGALCVKCHMPEQPYMVIDERADHSLRVPRPDLSQTLGTPNACSQGGCHDDRSLELVSGRVYEMVRPGQEAALRTNAGCRSRWPSRGPRRSHSSCR